MRRAPARRTLASRRQVSPRSRPAAATSDLALTLRRRQAWNSGRRRNTHLSTQLPASEPATKTVPVGSATTAGEEGNEQLIREALAARGTRYRWGGASRGGFDCSGLTRYLFARNHGVKLPHSARAQAHMGQKVSRDALQPGDLLFFRTGRRGISHVGVYIGNDKFVHAASTRRRVQVDSIHEPYYRNRFVTARRIPKATTPARKAAVSAVPVD